MDFKMADTSDRRVFCNTILLKYHDVLYSGRRLWIFRSYHLRNTLIQLFLNNGCSTPYSVHQGFGSGVLGDPEVSANLYCNSRTSVLWRLRDYLRLVMGRTLPSNTSVHAQSHTQYTVLPRRYARASGRVPVSECHAPTVGEDRYKCY